MKDIYRIWTLAVIAVVLSLSVPAANAGSMQIQARKRIFCNFNGCYSKRARPQLDDDNFRSGETLMRSDPSAPSGGEQVSLRQLAGRGPSPVFGYRGDMDPVVNLDRDMEYDGMRAPNKARELLLRLISRLRERKSLTPEDLTGTEAFDLKARRRRDIAVASKRNDRHN